MYVRAGLKFNTFTVLSLAAHGKLGWHKRWRVQCDCGRALVKDSSDIKRQKSCGCLSPKLNPKVAAYKLLKKRHTKYGGDIIGFRTFVKLSEKNCFFCGAIPSNNHFGWFYNGLDRIDCSGGYVRKNVRPCCWICNRMRGNMADTEFYWQIKKIIARSKAA